MNSILTDSNLIIFLGGIFVSLIVNVSFMCRNQAMIIRDIKSIEELIKEKINHNHEMSKGGFERIDTIHDGFNTRLNKLEDFKDEQLRRGSNGQ